MSSDSMVVFYEKPGCINNRRQQGWLREAGIQADVRDLLNSEWSAQSLRPFFADKPVCEWFNPTAPAVKQGEIDPHAISESDALAAMVANPILIRRPLVQFGEFRQSGFDLAALLAAMGRDDSVAEQVPDDIETCSKSSKASGCARPHSV